MLNKIRFPHEFDDRFYLAHNNLPQSMSPREASIHYLKIGKKRGYAGSPLAGGQSFVSFLGQLPFRSILEIGPGIAPKMN